MSNQNRRLVLAALGFACAAMSAFAQKSYDPGSSDTEIRIGQTVPYSGPASAYGSMGKVQAAYFKMLNDSGGINGRRIRLISLDDGYSPPKTVEMTRRLVEQEQVLFTINSLGTASNSAIHRYMNQMKVPHLFLASGASKWNDPRNFPWTLAFTPSYQSEGRVYAQHILRTRPAARIAVLYQNDDYGKDYLKGFADGLGDKAASMIVAQASYEVTDATVDSQIVTLQRSGADTLFNITTPKFAAQSIRRSAEVGWKPVHYLNSVSGSIAAVLKPAGLENAVGLISAQYIKTPGDPQWAVDPAMQEDLSFKKKYLPELDPNDTNCSYALAVAQLTTHVLRQAGDNLTRGNILRQATSLKSMQLPLVLPGVLVSTTPDDYGMFESLRLARFDGTIWVTFGEPVAVR